MGIQRQVGFETHEGGLLDRKWSIQVEGFDWGGFAKRRSNEIGRICRLKQAVAFGWNFNGQRTEIAIHDYWGYEKSEIDRGMEGCIERSGGTCDYAVEGQSVRRIEQAGGRDIERGQGKS